MEQNACLAAPQSVLDEQLSALFGIVERNEDLHKRLVTILEAEHPDDANVKCGMDPCSISSNGPTLEEALQRIFSRLSELDECTARLIERVERQVGRYKLLP